MSRELQGILQRLAPIQKEQKITSSPRGEELNEGAVVRFTLNDLLGQASQTRSINFGPVGFQLSNLQGLLNSGKASYKPAKK